MSDVRCWMFWFGVERNSLARVKRTVRVWLSLLGLLISLTMPACKPASEASLAPPQKPSAIEPTVDSLIQQATTQHQQRIQQAASLHAANAKRLQEAKVLEMAEVSEREHLTPKREVVRQFLASNQTLKFCLTEEEALFGEELKDFNVPPARIKAALQTFQSVIRAKAVNLQMRELDQQLGEAMLGVLDFLDKSWGEWTYNKEYSRVQFNQPGALEKYNSFMETIEQATKEQDKLRVQ